MARRKKKTAIKTPQPAPLDEKLQEELQALKAIYEDRFRILEDRLGCSVVIVPHPADEHPQISVVFEARFPAGYPANSLSVLIKECSADSLPAAQALILQNQLQNTAVACAAMGEVAVFTLASDASDWLQQYMEEHPAEGQESLYDQYRQREKSMKGTPGPDLSPNRFATLTQQWVKQKTILPQPYGDAVEDNTANSNSDMPRNLPLPQVEKAEAFSSRLRKGLPPSTVSSHGSPIGTVLSRSVAVVSQLAQHVKSSHQRRRPSSSVPRPDVSQNLAAADRINSSDAYHHAVIGASIDQTLTVQGLTNSERIATIELMQQAGVISRALGDLLMSPKELKQFCESVAEKCGHQNRVELAALLQGSISNSPKQSPSRTPADVHQGDQHDTCRWKSAGHPHRVSGSVPNTSPCRYHQDFIEQEQLGQGGFGVVVAAINRVDGRKYAIKKVLIGKAASPARVLLEVSTLSGLHHAHVVRYFQAWREEDPSLSGMASQCSTDFFASRYAHKSVPSSAAIGALGGHQNSVSLQYGAHAPMLAVGTDALPSEAPRQPPTSRLDTVNEVSLDRAGSPPSPSTSNMGHAVPRSTLGNSVPRRKFAEAASSDPSKPSTSPAVGLSESSAGVWQLEAPEECKGPLDSASGASLASSSCGSWSAPTGNEADSAFAFEKGSQVQPPESHTSQQRRTDSQEKHEILYIQMEYCPNTLRKQLRRGPLEDDQRWRVVRQLLSSLAYVHRRGIIHRDVKPDNVFYDARNDIKLGDFGLAKFTSSGAVIHPIDLQHATGQDTMSNEVGTELYMAPEVKDGKPYDAKVDLFSLGICVVEIFVTFDTEMERVVTLKNCREGIIPESMCSEHPMASRLALELLARNPDHRPTAAKVLKSHLLPASVADEQLADILRALPESPGMYEKIVDALFAVPDSSHTVPSKPRQAGEQVAIGTQLPSTIVSCDSMAAAGVPSLSNPSLILSMFRTVDNVCRTHGFVPMQSKLIGSFNIASGIGSVRLLSMNGQQVSLRRELRVPFCMWLVNQAAQSAGAFGTATAPAMGLESMRRYEIAQVFTSPAAPTVHWHTDIDVIDASRSEPSTSQGDTGILVSDAELLRIVLDIISSTDAVRGCGVEIRISHSDLLVAILDHVGVPASSQVDFLQAVMAYQQGQVRDRILKTSRRHKDWSELCQAMQQMQVPVGRAKTLLQQLPNDSAEAVKWLRSVLPVAVSDHTVCALALQQLEALTDFLGSWDVTTQDNVSVIVNPFMPIPAAYHHSVIYEVYVTLPWSGLDRATLESQSACELVCSGGRYDALLQSLWPWQLRNEHVPAPCGTGVTVDMSALERIAQALYGGRHHVCARPRTLSVADVLVAARGGGGMIKQRMQIVQMLWHGGISAETMHMADPSLMEQFTHAKARNMRCIVLLTQDQMEVKGHIKVKPLEKKMGEEDVPLHQLVSRLSEILTQR